ncbi:MAG: nitroreductase family protein [Nitrososphaerota archaeon]|jgi:nitroreductase|nr:nitroreductase family protein [Nitrososphaerota archaeon]
MDVFEAVKVRHSIRSYQDKPVPKEKLKKILEAAQLAPSARNIAPWHFIVVSDREKRQALAKGAYAKFAAQAPIVIVALGDKKASEKWHAIDTSLAIENMILTAVAEGLGTCCVGSFNETDIKETLKIPDNWEIIVMLTVGYAQEKLDLTSKFLGLIHNKKSLNEITSAEEYGKTLSL